MTMDQDKNAPPAPGGEGLHALMQRHSRGTLSDALGIEVTAAERGRLVARLGLRSDHLAPNGLVHAGTVVTIADTCAGMGCMASLPAGVQGFATAELKSNFLRSAPAGTTLICEARLEHGGRTTQVWDASVRREHDGATVALFRCTQVLLYGGSAS